MKVKSEKELEMLKRVKAYDPVKEAIPKSNDKRHV